MPKILRVQNIMGEGPYTGGACRDFYRLHEPPSHPNPMGEGLVYNMNGWRCGFKDREQLESWFNDRELEILKSRGYNVEELEVNEVIIGKKQLVFK